MATSLDDIDELTAARVAACNATGRTPVVLIHGLWLLSNSWQSWTDLFESNGYAPLPVGWPGDPETVTAARAHPDVLAGKTVGQLVDHHAAVIDRLTTRPAIVGHSFGGLLAQVLAGRGLSAATVAIAPAPFRGVLPVPVSALRAASPVLSNPANRGRAVALTYQQFRYAFANAVSREEARLLYETHAVPAPGAPLFQAALANLNPWSEVKVDTKNADRGPLLIVSGDEDQTVPWAVAHAAFRRQRRNPGTTEIVKMPGRGHALTIDAGWHEVADAALAFIRRFPAETRAPSEPGRVD
jgi:non-heme chloroperoxidase